MYGDFNRIVVQLTQHPVMYKPLSDLTYTECELAYALIRELIDLSIEGDYTLLDYIQMARLEYYLGELSCKISCSREETALHYAGALHLLEKGGFDLGIKKWVELVSLRIENSKKNDILILQLESDQYPLCIYPIYTYGIVNRQTAQKKYSDG